MNELTVVEKNLSLLKPKFSDVLAGSQLSPERLMRTIMISLERLPSLRECTMDSIEQAAMTAAVLNLEVDGVTGQGYLIPFKDNKRGIRLAQFVIGYKGYNTLAARSGYSINAAVVRAGDDFKYELGTNPRISHTPSPLPSSSRDITHAWACATSNHLPPIINVLSIDDILAVKARSAGARKSDSPWNDALVGFAAMAEKTCRRRLARSMPLNVMQLASAYDVATQEMGLVGHLDPDKGLVLDGVPNDTLSVSARLQAPTAQSPWVWVKQDGSLEYFEGPDEWESFIIDLRPRMSAARIQMLLERMESTFDDLSARDEPAPSTVARVKQLLTEDTDPNSGRTAS